MYIATKTSDNLIPRFYMCLPLRDAAPHVAGILHIGEFMEFQDWLNKNDSVKKYAHFDRRVKLSNVIDQIKDPQNIICHSFLPFIHQPLIYTKFSATKETPRYNKVRDIYFSSHYDRCIYQYYGYLLNQSYNTMANDYGINDVVLAYRSDSHQSNIHFSQRAFESIRQTNKCMIMVGDFKNFFDSLDHKYLKQQIMNILHVDMLPRDYYAVYKNITKFSYVEMERICQYKGLKYTTGAAKKLKHSDLIMSVKELRNANKLSPNSNKFIIRNNNDYGIPQGSAISAVLSNIYMLEFDKAVSEIMTLYNGTYMRYSDDTIFIVPINMCDDFIPAYIKIKEIINSIPNLILQEEKTTIFEYDNGTLTNKSYLANNKDDKHKVLNYLGFSFDGKKIYIRDKTITKYYYRAYGRINTINKACHTTPNNKIISGKKLYKKYTLKGASAKKLKEGNFISYLLRCKKVYGSKEGVCKIINTHYGKIKKKLNEERKT